MIKELKGLKQKLEILKFKNDNRLNKVMEEIDVTNESIIFFEKKLDELNIDKDYIEVANRNFKKVKKEIINTIILAFLIVFGITLIKSGIELVLGKYLLKVFIQKLLITQLANVSLCCTLSLILTSQVKKKFKCKSREEIDKEIYEKSKQLKISKNKLKVLQQRKKDLENIDLDIKTKLNNIIENNFIIEENVEISKQKVKK